MGFLSDEQRLSFEANGYLMVEDALDQQELSSVLEACDRAEHRWRENPELIGTRIPEFEEIEGILEYDPIFLDLVDHRKVFPLIWELLGPDIQLLDHSYYRSPPGGLVDGTAWHSDVGRRLNGVYHPRSMVMLRLIYALTDIDENGGATLVLPGSHRFAADFEMPSAKWPEELPGCVRLTCRAGAAYFYNGNLWHAPSNNRSDRTRRMLLYNFGHRWMRMWKGHEPSQQLLERTHTDMRKQLLGLNRAYYGRDADAGFGNAE